MHLDVPGLRLRGNVWVSEEVDINEVEGVEGPAFIGANCRIADGASIGPYSVLSRGVIVREGARVTRSVVDAGTYLGRSSVVEGAIVGRGCDLRDHVRVHEGVAIGDQVTIGPEASLFPGVRVYPFKEIETGAQIHESVVWETTATSTPFGPDGARGLVNVDLTPETAVRLAAALGTRSQARRPRRREPCVAGRVPHDPARDHRRAHVDGCARRRPADLACRGHPPRPQDPGAPGGIHVGRSSVDPEVIHVRVFESPGNQMTVALQKEVEKHFSRQELRRATFAEVGETTYPARVQDSYAQDILDALDVGSIRRRRFRVAVDYGYSPAAFTLPLVLGPLGVEAIGARGFFAEDVTEEELEPTDARRIVIGVRADLGVVLDRAAERLVVVDERGEAVPADLGLLLVVRLLALAGRSGRIAVPITTTGLVEQLVEGSQLTVVRTPHSLSELTRAATEDGVVLAAAPTGGFVFPDVVPGYDAVTALCKLLELLATQERPVSELVADLPRPTLVHQALPCPWGRKGLVMRLLNEQLATRRLDLMDGVKAYDDRGWVQVLPDPDEPLVHLYAEGETEELTEELAAEVAALVETIVQGDAAEQRTLEQASS